MHYNPTFVWIGGIGSVKKKGHNIGSKTRCQEQLKCPPEMPPPCFLCQPLVKSRHHAEEFGLNKSEYPGGVG